MRFMLFNVVVLAALTYLIWEGVPQQPTNSITSADAIPQTPQEDNKLAIKEIEQPIMETASAKIKEAEVIEPKVIEAEVIEAEVKEAEVKETKPVLHQFSKIEIKPEPAAEIFENQVESIEEVPTEPAPTEFVVSEPIPITEVKQVASLEVNKPNDRAALLKSKLNMNQVNDSFAMQETMPSNELAVAEGEQFMSHQDRYVALQSIIDDMELKYLSNGKN